MSKKTNLKWLSRDLLTSPYCYALALNEKEFHSELKRMKMPPKQWPAFMNRGANATTHFFEQTDSTGLCAIVCVDPTRRADIDVKQTYALLVHEAVHIWQACRDSMGEKYPGAESEAYAVQRISQSLMFSYDEQTKKKKGRKK